jgi:AmmeMemoRadiSam system protein A
MLPLTEADQQTLLRMARDAIVEYVHHHRLPEVQEPPEALRQPCGAFVTLRKGKRLRGCIGYVEAVRPLYTTVRECAVAAALHDPRFCPVAPQEIPELSLEISVLSPLAEITPEKIEIGRHGLLISRGAQRGLLLPQVAVEWNWDREELLEETCLKAGLPPDAWRLGATIQAFTAQVFEEPDPAPSSHHSEAAK